MNTNRRWTVEIFINEKDGHTTSARARLDTNDDRHVHAQGNAQRCGVDIGRPDIRDHLAVASALSELANKITRRGHRKLGADHG
jgi:Domain of unknown function (DUF1876)